MSTNIVEKRKVFYLSPKHGWQTEETPDTKYRLTAVARTQVISQIENEMEIRNPRGGWDEVNYSEEQQLSAVERGFTFNVKPRQGKDQAFLEITSKRFIDEEILRGFFEGLRLYDRNLEELETPETAIDIICIPLVEAESFYQRAKVKGAQLVEDLADLQAMYQKLTQLSEIRQEMERLCGASRAVIDQIAEGIQTEAPSLNERSKTVQYLREKTSELIQDIKNEKLVLDRHPGQIEHKAYGSAYLQNALDWQTQIEKLFQEHRSYEVQAINLIQETLSQSLPSTESPAATRRYLMMPLVEYYTEKGYDCRLTEDGLIIRHEGTVIELADKPSVKTPQGEETAEVKLGRQTAERTQREL